MPPEVRTLPQRVEAETPKELGRFAALVARYFDEAQARPKFTAGEEDDPDPDDRVITLQVLDRLGRPWQRRWAVLIWISETAGGPPMATQTVAGFGGGTVLDEILTDATYLILTEADGSAEFTVNATGAETRFFNGIVLGQAATSPPVVWAA